MKCLLIASALAIPTQASADAADDLVARGAYLATVMDCAGCHMPRGSDGAPLFESGLSGGTVGFEIPGLGVGWAPNLSPSDTGLVHASAWDAISAWILIASWSIWNPMEFYPSTTAWFSIPSPWLEQSETAAAIVLRQTFTIRPTVPSDQNTRIDPAGMQ